MRTVLRLAGIVIAGLIAVMPVAVYAQQAGAESLDAANSIEAVNVVKQGSAMVLRVTLKKPLKSLPGSFSVSNPARIAIDFPETRNGLGKSAQVFNEGDLRSVNIVQAGDRTRLVLNLIRPLSYDTRTEDRNVLITLTSLVADSATAGRGARFAAGAPAMSHAIRDINFRRGKDGEGRIIVDLSDANTGIDIRQQGGALVVDFLKTNLPDSLRKRLDVTDFATPVMAISSSSQGPNAHMVITPKGLWEHNAYQSDTQFVIEVKQVVEDPKKLVQGTAQKFGGEKLSLNFQNIDVRSVLQVIADFTNFNIITSDTVSGNLTLRLKDVPWDQALDIIMQAKGLDMRKNGNVIWIAPRDEMANREKLEFEAKQQITELEPLRTESFQLNYQKANDVLNFVQGGKDTGGSATKSALMSKRGHAVIDERTNKVFVTDIGARLEDIRRVIAEIDVPARQVLIEAQVVEASDNFTRNLGMRLGVGGSAGGVVGTTSAGVQVGRFTFGGGTADTGYFAGLVKDIPKWQTDGLGVNLPAASISGAQPGQLSFVLWNSNATRFLSMEISALEADGRGKVISRPRVMTADQMEALIEQGVEIPYLSATSSGATSVSYRKANLSLKVKPHITPDAKVTMELEISKDSVNTTIATGAGLAIDQKHVKTEVLVENGGTIVIGGIYSQDTANITNKIPFLGDLPVAGYLFRDNHRTDNKTELLFFITPRIVSEQATAR